jgi:hypothetical protein
MNEAESNYDMTTSCEGSEELNGKEASTRNAPMISAPRSVQKMYRRGALVPMGKWNEASDQ